MSDEVGEVQLNTAVQSPESFEIVVSVGIPAITGLIVSNTVIAAVAVLSLLHSSVTVSVTVLLPGSVQSKLVWLNDRVTAP